MHPQEWREFARVRWAEWGWKPKQILDAMEKEFGRRVKYRTLKPWADDGGWKYFEDSDTPKKSNPNEPFGVSGITDPIYHLSLVMGKRLIREDGATRSTDTTEYGSRPSTIVAQALEEINLVYDPGPDTIDYLKPVLARYVHSVRRATKTGRENRLNEDIKPNIQSRNRLDAIREEAPLLDGAYRIISESVTDQMLKPPEEGDNP